VEALLSHNGIEYQLHDMAHQPLSADELWALLHDSQGRQTGPFTRIGNGPSHPKSGLNVVLGFDPIRLQERLEEDPEGAHQGATVYGRPLDSSTERVLEYLAEHGVTARLVDLDVHPVSKEDLVEMLSIPNAGNRAAYTSIDGTVVLGYDIPRLREILGRELRAPTAT
jgi:arsenate reductase-like glutaredoxin family protein